MSKRIIWKRMGMAILAMMIRLPLQRNVTASGPSTFKLEATVSGQQVAVAVTGENLQDLYAFDFIFDYDPRLLKFIAANSEIAGFSVAPIVNAGEIRFAHTKIGPTSGINGKAALVSLAFEQIIGGGQTSIKLIDAKLVDSKDQVTHLQPNIQANVTESPFADIAGHWAEAIIFDASERGFATGYPDGTFRPQQPVTRAEFTALLVRALSVDAPQDGQLAFADREDMENWAVPFAAAAVQSGWIGGYDDRTFRGNNMIMRQEAAAIAVRALGAAIKSEEQPDFVDHEDIQPWARGFAAAAADAGLMRGKENKRFAPLDRTTRAEAVAIILNLIYAQTQDE